MLDAMSHRAHFNPAIAYAKSDGPAEIASDCLSNEGNAIHAESLPGCYQIALAHLHCSRRSQCSEHARPTRQSPCDAFGSRSVGAHQLEHARHGRLGESGRVAIFPGQRGRGQEHVSQAADPRLGVVEHDRNTASQADRDQDVLGHTDPKVCNSNHQLPSAHAARR
jgi:hypothetical protein